MDHGIQIGEGAADGVARERLGRWSGSERVRSRRFWRELSLVCLVGTMTAVAIPQLVLAQADEPEAQPVQAPAQSLSETDDDTVMSLILQSGVSGLGFILVLGLFSLVGATVAIERAVNTRRSKIIPEGFVSELYPLLRSSEARPESFRALCDRWRSPIATVLDAGLLRAGRPLPEVEKSMEDAAAREMAAYRGSIRPLSVVGSIAPLVGLLGTVLGMIVAFRTASQAGLGKGELMAQGIYLALLTTAGGLMIAIPALLLASLFQARVEKMFREIDCHLMQTMPSFARMEGGAVSPTVTGTARQ